MPSSLARRYGQPRPGVDRRIPGAAAALLASATVPVAAPLTYTPRHLAERILADRAALEGEREQVTVLFADLKG